MFWTLFVNIDLIKTDVCINENNNENERQKYVPAFSTNQNHVFCSQKKMKYENSYGNFDFVWFEIIVRSNYSFYVENQFVFSRVCIFVYASHTKLRWVTTTTGWDNYY